ncbi:hypothetical protein AJ80_06710 [Polytolypa hystricis UAMH7299]|uniref:NAD(+) diphosphatase n=1 Tax=Polytolypa hystricis (strain UAMH7299) TaxID=1447883 RepID=A0A2B7XUG2_POLH7|nr:hypothetical protein AJ80_06710 [Polytolypa hystricis UAMH7299]
MTVVPTPRHLEAESMLSRKFGKETVNYFGGSPLNRVAFLRTESPFLSAALKHPTSRFLLFNHLAPLVRTPSEIYYASYKDLEPLVPADTYDKSEDEVIKEYDSAVARPLLIFLGLDQSGLQGELTYKDYKGTPYFAVDLTPKGSFEVQAKGVISAMESQGLSFDEGRVISAFPADVAGVYAHARALLDWNTRNVFCGTCGHPTLSVNAGTKRACPATDAALVRAGASTDGSRPICTTRTTISNISFPRTDPTIIVAVLSHDAQRMLLGRQKRWPAHWYSTLAGFLEPAESIEDAVRREVWEESGVVLSRVIIHSSQPWPYPANLMIGAIAQVGCPADETINLKHDPELEDAKWFDIAEVQEALDVGTSALGEPPGPGYKEGGLRLPPKTAIAYQLIAAVTRGDVLAGIHEAKI